METQLKKLIEPYYATKEELQPLNAKERSLRAVIDNNFIEFLRTVFADRVTDEFSDRMTAAVDDTVYTLNSVQKAARGFPRGFGKTTMFSIAFNIWLIVTKRVKFSVVVGSSQTWANSQVLAIQDEFLGNTVLRRLYGEFREGSKWSENDSIVEGFRGDNKYQAKFIAIGRGGSIRGQLFKVRPQFVLLDDIEKLEESYSPTQIEKTLKWVANTVLKMGNTETRYLWLGTVLEKDCAFDQVLKGAMGFFSGRYSAIIKWSKAQNLWDEWGKLLALDIKHNDSRYTLSEAFFQKNKPAMMDGTVVLWEQHRNYKYLMYIYYTEGATSFYKEMQNDPKSARSGFFIPRFREMSTEEIMSTRRYCVVDPSLGKIMPSAIVDFGFNAVGGSGIMSVFDASIKHRKPDELIEDVIKHIVKYKISVLIVESVQYQDFLRMIIEEKIRNMGLKVVVLEFHSPEKKESRIESLQPLINTGRIEFNSRLQSKEMGTELSSYPASKFVDGLDALSMGVIKVQNTIMGYGDVEVYKKRSDLLYVTNPYKIDKDGRTPVMRKLLEQKKRLERNKMREALTIKDEEANGIE